MFEPSDRPRLFGLAPGVDFPVALIDGIFARMASRPPEDIARIQVFVNTRRMARRLRALFEAGPPTLLPRIRLVTDLGTDPAFADIPPAVSPLRRRLELTQLVSVLLDQEPDLAPRAALFDLADSLADMMAEMQGEGVPPEIIDRLDIGDSSGHWQRSRKFLSLVTGYFDASAQPPDADLRQRMVVERLARQWADTPPQDPILVAGSTGSRGTTALFMQAVARLPQGAVILPGVDFEQPKQVWDTMSEALTSEDHPQFRFHRVANLLGLHPKDIVPWTNTAPPNAARNALVSLAMRPAPVTDQWLSDGPKLAGIDTAAQDMTLVEAPTRRTEAMAIALRLRQAAEDGQTAALITPDRMLGRQVTAALDRWGILPDDSAGLPIPLTAAGRFLRHVGALFGAQLTADMLLTLLKHPLAHSGDERGQHLLRTHRLELHIRKRGMPFPTRAAVMGWAETQANDPGAVDWVRWLFDVIEPCAPLTTASLETFVAHHLTAAERLSQGAQGAGSGTLWEYDAGKEARRVTEDLRRQAAYGGTLSAYDYVALFYGVLNQHEVRASDTPHPHILIWGTLEARVQGADLIILGGLNDGTWPEPAAPDPWLNRDMRNKAGLLLPERRIGLSAHDYQQAIGAREVWITRSTRSDDAETVASRWLSRLVNLLEGLPEGGGPAAVAGMRARGQFWLNRVAAMEATEPMPRAQRPSPRPPVEVRPRELSVTEIPTLIRDPYAIYARHILRLRPLDPIAAEPDAPLRGTVIHDILEQFIRHVMTDPACLSEEHLMQITGSVLAEKAPWPAARALWKARVGRFAAWFVEQEQERRKTALPLRTEVRGRLSMTAPAFTLKAKADRIDRTNDGQFVILDYKTGAPPSEKQQMKFDKQLLLEAAMAENGAFADLDPAEVCEAVYLGLGNPPKASRAPLDKAPPAQVLAELQALIAAYLEVNQGFTARRAMEKDTDPSNYDTLSRFGEWDATQDPRPEDLG